jgi:hypothetical protein
MSADFKASIELFSSSRSSSKQETSSPAGKELKEEKKELHLRKRQINKSVNIHRGDRLHAGDMNLKAMNRQYVEIV